VNEQSSPVSAFTLWVPRIVIAISIVFLIYLTYQTYTFSGYYDETFLDQANMEKIRGPWAKKMYYERGDLDYQGKPLFTSEKGEEEIAAEAIDESTGVISLDVPAATKQVEPLPDAPE